MYSKEQISTRLKLGVSINSTELVLIIKGLAEKIETIEKQMEDLNNVKPTQLSPDRRTVNYSTGEDIQASSIQSGFKL